MAKYSKNAEHKAAVKLFAEEFGISGQKAISYLGKRRPSPAAVEEELRYLRTTVGRFSDFHGVSLDWRNYPQLLGRETGRIGATLLEDVRAIKAAKAKAAEAKAKEKAKRAARRPEPAPESPGQRALWLAVERFERGETPGIALSKNELGVCGAKRLKNAAVDTINEILELNEKHRKDFNGLAERTKKGKPPMERQEAAKSMMAHLQHKLTLIQGLKERFEYFEAHGWQAPGHKPQRRSSKKKTRRK